MSTSVPYKINWLDLNHHYTTSSVAIGSLPGSTHRFMERNYEADLSTLLSAGLTHAIIMCDHRELTRFGVPNLLNEERLIVHHYPCEIGLDPGIENVLKVHRIVYRVLEAAAPGGTLIIISRDGLGRSCLLAATLLLQMDDALNYTDAFERIKGLMGPRAIQTVKVCWGVGMFCCFIFL